MRAEVPGILGRLFGRFDCEGAEGLHFVVEFQPILFESIRLCVLIDREDQMLEPVDR